jgi:hypothetical protein
MLKLEILDVKEETAKMFQARRFWMNAEDALRFIVDTRFVFSKSKPDIFTDEMAGSSAQSATVERLEVVARGIPFSRSSVPPAVVSSAPLIKTPAVAKIVDVVMSFKSAIPDDR